MNTPSPLVPQGAFQDKGKSHVRITVFAILAVHVVLLGVLLIAGCNKKTDLADGSTPPPAGQDQWPSATPPPGGNPVNPGPGTPPAPDAHLTAPPPLPLPTPTPLPGDTSAPPPIPGAGTGTGLTPPSTPGGTVVAPGGETPPPPPPPPVETGTGTEHTIAKGETLATIGKKYGVGYKAIEAANPSINPTRLKIGDKIKIPAPSKTPSAPAPTAGAATGSSPTVYVVRSGDNLLKIAKSMGVPVKQLRAANNLRTDQIKVGQRLKIPARHTVAPAEAATAPPPVAPPITLPTGQ